MTQKPQKGKHPSAQGGLSQLVFTKEPTVASSAQQDVAPEGKPRPAPPGELGTEREDICPS